MKGAARLFTPTAGRLGWVFLGQPERHPFGVPAPRRREVPPQRPWHALLQDWLQTRFAVPGAVLAGAAGIALGWLTLQVLCGVLGFAVTLIAPILVSSWCTERCRRRAAAAADAEYSDAHRCWALARAAHDRAESQRLSQVCEWGAVGLQAGWRRCEVFGGNLWSWEAFLTVFGTSLLSASPPVTVLDLSEEGVSGELAELAGQAGYLADCQILPGDLERCDLLRGVDPDQLAEILVESIYGDEQGASRAGRAMDSRILAAVGEELAKTELSLGRLGEALRALLGEPAEPALLSAPEWDRIASELFSAEYVKQAHERLRKLEAFIHPLRRLGTSPPPGPRDSQLRILAIANRGVSAQSDLLIDLVVQWALREVSGSGTAAARTLIVAGIDRLPRRHLERLADACERHGVRLVRMCRHLRGEAVGLLGGGPAVFMTSEARREVPRQQDVERQLQSAVPREAGRAVEAAQPARHSEDAEAIRPARHHSPERAPVLAAVAEKMVAVEESQPAETRARPERSAWAQPDVEVVRRSDRVHDSRQQVQSRNEPDRVQADRANAAQESRREPPALPAARIASPLEQAWVDRRETVEARERTADPKATPRFADEPTAASQAQPEAAPASWGPWERPEQRARAAPEPESAERVEIAPEPDRVPPDEAAPDAEAIRPVLLALASARIPGALEVAALKRTTEPVPAIPRSAHQPEVAWRDTVAGTAPARERIETVPDAEDSPPRLAPPGPEPDPAAAMGDRGGPPMRLPTTREEGLLRLAAGPVNLAWHSMDRLRDAADALVDRAEENGWGWRAVRDLRDLGDQTAGWLGGHVAYHPGYYGGPNEETEDLIPTLARLNRAGFVTTFSQPGFPPDENGWTQRAAVEGLADAAVASRLAKAAAANGLVCSVYPPPHPLIRNDYSGVIPVTAQGDFVHTTAGSRLSRATVRGLLFRGHGRAGRIAARAWQVTVTDPVWGRNTMWDALERWACSREGTEPE